MSGFYEENGEDKTIKKTVVMAILAASLVFLAFLLLLYNKTKPEKPAANANAEAVSDSEEEDLEIGKSNMTSEDLDFWDMFRDDTEDEQGDLERRDQTEGKPAVFTEQGPQPDMIKEASPEDETDTKWDTGDPNDGKHIQVTDRDGKATWYEILDIPKSTLSATFLKENDNGSLSYDQNGKKAAQGADLNSSSAGCDFSALKDAGVTFVMLRAIYRDPATALIMPDNAFSDLSAKAKEAELNTGVYIDTAAINENEAIEEANYAITNAKTIDAKYPVAISIPENMSSSDRMSNLSNEERTKIVKAFCDQVRSFGLKPMIRATKADLIAKLNMEDLTAYDIWVIDAGEKKDGHPYFTDYPYVFTVWQYGNGSKIGQNDENLRLDLSFTDYEQN